jgi:hypothetical protein
MGPVPPLLSLAVVLAAAFVKGAVGFGFPTISTPVLALFIDVKSAVALLLLPNITMDAIQIVRRPGLADSLWRHAGLYAGGVVGMVGGTYLLRLATDRAALLILGAFVLVFVALNAAGLRFHVAPAWERRVAPPVGVLAGLVGGLTNVPLPALLYLYALQMDKAEFVRSLSLAFIILKTTQLLTVTGVGLMSPALLRLSLLATGVALAAFWLGLRVQDRMNQRAFNRAVLAVMTVVGLLLLGRGL